ncbi:MAG TPA: hypothetical protein VKG25_02970 [Bryobacteraceae bacterium]|nr:hypothetical protein [Bryobacteraceae bacterium]
MSHVTLKSSTIFISVGDKTRVYRSVEEVPPPLRKKLEQSTNGIHSATILIADRRGREEILRAIRGGSNLKTRLTSLRNEAVEESKPAHRALWLLRSSVEFVIPAMMGLLTYLLISLK